MRHLGSTAGAAIASLDKRRRSKQQNDAELLERLAIRAGMHPSSASQLALNLAPLPKSKTEPFIMLHPMQNAAVVRWLRAHSKRPQVATALWAELFTAVHPATGDVLLTRDQLADRLGIAPANVSRLMTELVSINAVKKRREGRRVVYQMNPNVATHIAGPESRAEAREEAGPLLTIMQGGAA